MALRSAISLPNGSIAATTRPWVGGAWARASARTLSSSGAQRLMALESGTVSPSVDASGLRVKSGMTFPGEGQASGAAQGVNALGMMAKLLGGQVKGGLSIDELQVNPSGATTNDCRLM